MYRRTLVILAVVGLLLTSSVLIMFSSIAQANGSQFLASYADPQNPQQIFAIFDYAATEGGRYLLHSQNGGRTWKKVLHPSNKTAISIYGRGYVVGDFFIVVGPLDHPRLVITYGNGAVWRATSDLRWKEYAAPDQSSITKFIPTNHPDSFFAIVQKSGPSNDEQLFRTDTGGTSWQKVNEKLPFGCSFQICNSFASTDSRVLVIERYRSEAEGGYISRDGGKNWNSLSRNQLTQELKALEPAGKKLWPIKGTPDQIKAAIRAIEAKALEAEEEFERARRRKQR